MIQSRRQIQRSPRHSCQETPPAHPGAGNRTVRGNAGCGSDVMQRLGEVGTKREAPHPPRPLGMYLRALLFPTGKQFTLWEGSDTTWVLSHDFVTQFSRRTWLLFGNVLY